MILVGHQSTAKTYFYRRCIPDIYGGGILKFSDGYWNLRKGVTLHSPAEARDISAEQKLLNHGAHEKFTIERHSEPGQLTFEFSSPFKIIGVKIFHHKGKGRLGPHFSCMKIKTPCRNSVYRIPAMLVSGDLSVQIKETPPRWTILSGNLTEVKEISGYLDVNFWMLYARTA